MCVCVCVCVCVWCGLYVPLFLNEPELICLQFNSFKYYNLTLIILFAMLNVFKNCYFCVFYRISTFLCYLIHNSVYMWILYDLSANSLYVILFLNEPELICLYTVKRFQWLISYINNSIQHKSFDCTLLNNFKYYYPILGWVIWFNGWLTIDGYLILFIHI